MNALSMSSKEWVELPSTRLSIRIQPSSYMNEAAPVRQAASVSQRAHGSRLGRTGAASVRAAGSVSPRGSAPITSESATLRIPATRMVPGRPTASIRTKPLTRTPTAAPRLLAK